MSKIRLTKSDLKKQKESLKRFTQYLPTLQLKKQQLQMEVNKIQRAIDEEKEHLEYVRGEVYKWVDVFAENIDLEQLLRRTEVLTETENIAGVDIPVFKSVGVKGEEYDRETVPLWVDEGMEAIEEVLTLKVKVRTFEKQLELIREELRITSQRVNLFEKVMIPDAKENIRKIQIFLGDMQTAEVVTGKIAKEKIERKTRAEN